MTNQSNTHGHAAAHAYRAFGSIVRVNPETFIAILKKTQNPVVVTAKHGIFFKHYRSVTSYQGITFFTKTEGKIGQLPSDTFLVIAKKIAIPQELCFSPADRLNSDKIDTPYC